MRLAGLLLAGYLAGSVVGSATAQLPAHARLPTRSAYDLAWARAFAASGVSDEDHKWDPHFQSLMRTSFRQRQSFWRDHGRFPSLPELVQLFLGVPGSAKLDEDRFLTLDGCVPHACSVRGMVWIDTRGTGKPMVIFVAPEDVSGADAEKAVGQHLWLYASDKLNWQKMPADFESSLGRWYAAYRAIWKKYYAVHVVMLTLVEPSGLTYDLSPGLFPLGEDQEKDTR